ncbi:hypothetical protein CSPX01_14243 [Colletotrichum filicis]|nr:hypothetical protein CSPX01_14243 [Colletotrichum filicis]
MSDNQGIKERPSKRSLTPNKALYASFNEAHRHIAPPTPKIPTEFDGQLGDGEQLTEEQVEDILSASNNSSSQFKDSKGQKEPKSLELLAEPNASSHQSKVDKQTSPSTVVSQTQTTDHGPQRSSSPYLSDDENAFIDYSNLSLHEFKEQHERQDSIDDPFDSQHAATEYPDASSFYPEDGDDYSLASIDHGSMNKIKVEPRSSPILASSPILSPPVAASPSWHTEEADQSSHIDDVVKKDTPSDYFNTTHLSGLNGTQYPIFLDHEALQPGNQSNHLPIFIDRGVLPPHSIPADHPVPTVKQTSESDSEYDGDASGYSEDEVTNLDKGKAPVKLLNPFHAFSNASSHASEHNAEQSESGKEKVFLRPHAEKEVSRALHHVTGLSQPSSGLIGRVRHSNLQNSRQSPYHSSSHQQKNDFYHAPAIQPDWQITQSGIKVPVPVPAPFTGDEIGMQATEPYNAIDHTRMATVASEDGEERTGLEGDEDWRTVTDDREFPTGFMGRVMTGSSIANVSDALLVQHQQQHPVAHHTTSHKGREPSTTRARAWWETSTPLPSIPSRSASPSYLSPPARALQNRQRRQDGWEEIELDPMPAPYPDFSWDRVRNHRAQVHEEAAEPSRNEYANLPFPLVPREDAAKLQAFRRASGLEDHTLSGHIISPGRPYSSNGGSHVYPRPALRKKSTRSFFSRTENQGIDRRTIFIDRQQQPFGRPTREYFPTQYSSVSRPQTTTDQARARERVSTPSKMASISHQAAAEALAIDQSAGRRASPHLYSSEVMERYRALQAVRQLGGRGTDTELADMAATVRDQTPLSRGAVRRQAVFYYAVMGATLLLPFVGAVTLVWSWDRVLAGLTGGECTGLSFHQRRNLRIMLLVGMALWVVAFVGGLVAFLSLRG